MIVFHRSASATRLLLQEEAAMPEESKYFESMKIQDIKTKEEFEEQYAKEEVVANVLYYKVVEWVCNQVKITE